MVGWCTIVILIQLAVVVHEAVLIDQRFLFQKQRHNTILPHYHRLFVVSCFTVFSEESLFTMGMKCLHTLDSHNTNF